MDVLLLKERSSAYRNLVKTEDALPIYECVNRGDLADIVIAAREVLLTTNRMPLVPKMEKTEERCLEYKAAANRAFGQEEYQIALEQWNKALCHAPEGSELMTMVHARRSALFYKIGAYGAAMAEIDMCFRLGCAPEVEDRLKYFHRQCREVGWTHNLRDEVMPDIHSFGKFFKTITAQNPQIQTCSDAVGIANIEGVKTVVAAKFINAGSLVAMETAFVSQTNDTHKYVACSFCHKMALSLTPCAHCCDTLFCSPVCKEMALKEYHEIECHLSEVLRNTSTECRMALKAVVRMRAMSANWDVFLAQTKKFGKERMAETPVMDAFDDNYPFTLLCVEAERPFAHGTMYNAAIDCAVVLYYLEKLSYYLPTGPQKQEALKAIARVMMHLSLYHTFTQMQVVIGRKNVDPYSHEAQNMGWFSLISKVKNACVPNVIALALNKDVALVAIEPIERGSEITLAHLGHHLEGPRTGRERQRAMFALTGALCRCRLCLGEAPPRTVLSEKQKIVMRRLDLEIMMKRVDSQKVDLYYQRLARGLGQLSDLPFSDEYADIYLAFRRCLRFYQVARFPQRLEPEPSNSD